jgi:hypothetical protein
VVGGGECDDHSIVLSDCAKSKWVLTSVGPNEEQQVPKGNQLILSFMPGDGRRQTSIVRLGNPRGYSARVVEALYRYESASLIVLFAILIPCGHLSGDFVDDDVASSDITLVRCCRNRIFTTMSF